MSNNRKVLKVMSIIYLFLASRRGRVLTAASGDASGDLSVYSVVVIVMGIVEIIALPCWASAPQITPARLVSFGSGLSSAWYAPL